jgi:myo-inositol 2-dehydrogenase/D-chiro-inositol 1-dehydrogenase
MGEVDEIFTAAGVMVNPEIGKAGDVDTAVITLKFKSGAIGTIDNSREAVYGYDQRVEVLGSKGSIATGNCFPNQAVVSTSTEVRRDLPLNFFMERYAESFATELQAFISAIADGREPPVTGLDGRMPVLMGMAANKSCKEGRPVQLKEVGSVATV